MEKLRKFEENSVVFLFGGVLYSLLEICFRGHTHWSMTLTGGLCFLILYCHFEANPMESLMAKCFFGMTVITAAEFVTGCIVNVILDWNVWDYSSQPMNLLGQICPLFSGMWFMLTIPASYLCKAFVKQFSAP